MQGNTLQEDAKAQNVYPVMIPVILFNINTDFKTLYS